MNDFRRRISQTGMLRKVLAESREVDMRLAILLQLIQGAAGPKTSIGIVGIGRQCPAKMQPGVEVVGLIVAVNSLIQFATRSQVFRPLCQQVGLARAQALSFQRLENLSGYLLLESEHFLGRALQLHGG